MDKSKVTIDVLRNTCKSLNYKFFENGDYNLNIIGIRAYPGVVNKFDDLLCLAYKENSKWVLKKYDITTDPGLYYLNNPMNVAGAALVKEGQYYGAYVLGMHKGKPALTQAKPILLYRDNNKDNKHDFIESSVVSEMAGINIHRAGLNSVQVDKWSAGCQVVSKDADMEEILVIAKKTIDTNLYGKSFTYTLLNEKQLVL